jgi:hypothetical protein
MSSRPAPRRRPAQTVVGNLPWILAGVAAVAAFFCVSVGVGGVVTFSLLRNKTPDAATKGPDKKDDGPLAKDNDPPARLHGIPFDAIAPRHRLEQVKAVQIRGQIKFAVAPNVNDVAITWEGLNRLKYDETVGPSSMVILLLGKDGWMKMGNRHIMLQGDGLGFYQNFNYATVLSNLIALTEEGFVEKGGDTLVRGRNCSCVTVKRAGRPDMNMFFEKDTSLLFKADFTGRFVDLNLNFTPNTTFVEFYFTDYEVVQGIKHWKIQEQWRDGMKYSEMKLSEVRFLDRADDALFMIQGLEREIQKSTDNKAAGTK